MKDIIFLILAFVLISCTGHYKNEPESNEIDYADLSKNSISQLSTYNKKGIVFPDYRLLEDTIFENSRLFTEVWLTDSMLQRIAIENFLKYEKTLYIDSLGEFNWDRAVIVEKGQFDTLNISFKSPTINKGTKIENRSWSILFNSKFSDKYGNTYDTNFVHVISYYIIKNTSNSAHMP